MNGERSRFIQTLWRVSLLPLGREAALKKAACVAVQREQAPSPQEIDATLNKVFSYKLLLKNLNQVGLPNVRHFPVRCTSSELPV
jgi:hypothetical protein